MRMKRRKKGRWGKGEWEREGQWSRKGGRVRGERKRGGKGGVRVGSREISSVTKQGEDTNFGKN